MRISKTHFVMQVDPRPGHGSDRSGCVAISAQMVHPLVDADADPTIRDSQHNSDSRVALHITHIDAKAMS